MFSGPLFSGAGRAMCPRCARKGARHATGFGCRLSASVRGGAPAPRQPRAVLRVVRFRRGPARPKPAFIKAGTGRRRLTGRRPQPAMRCCLAGICMNPLLPWETQRPFADPLQRRRRRWKPASRGRCRPEAAFARHAVGVERPGFRGRSWCGEPPTRQPYPESASAYLTD